MKSMRTLGDRARHLELEHHWSEICVAVSGCERMIEVGRSLGAEIARYLQCTSLTVLQIRNRRSQCFCWLSPVVDVLYSVSIGSRIRSAHFSILERSLSLYVGRSNNSGK